MEQALYHIIPKNIERGLPNMLIRGKVEFTCMSTRENVFLEMPHLPIDVSDRVGGLMMFPDLLPVTFVNNKQRDVETGFISHQSASVEWLSYRLQ